MQRIAPAGSAAPRRGLYGARAYGTTIAILAMNAKPRDELIAGATFMRAMRKAGNVGSKAGNVGPYE